MTNVSEKNIEFVSRRTIIDKINAEFSKFDPDYVRKKRLWQAKLNVLSQRLLDLQKRSNPMFRSDQIEIEARWLVNYRSEWPLVEKRLDDLWLSLDDTESADQRNQIQDSDGAVARGSIEWIFKLDPTIDYIQQKGIELEHIQPLTFLAPLLDPKELLATVRRLQISDVARTGRNYRSANCPNLSPTAGFGQTIPEIKSLKKSKRSRPVIWISCVRFNILGRVTGDPGT